MQRTVFTAGPPFGTSCHLPANLIVTSLTFVIRNAPGGDCLLIVFLNPLWSLWCVLSSYFWSFFLSLFCLHLIGGSIFLVLSWIVSAEFLVGGRKNCPFPVILFSGKPLWFRFTVSHCSLLQLSPPSVPFPPHNSSSSLVPPHSCITCPTNVFVIAGGLLLEVEYAADR